VNVAQIAPSVQATASNLDRVHGGARPWGAALVCDTTAARLSDTVESEQGTRFVGKFNRNTAVLCDVDPPLGMPLRWVRTQTLLRLLDQDFRVNTDARSVLAGMPWGFLAPAGPFAGAAGGFGEELRASFMLPVATAMLAAVDGRLAGARRHGGAAQIVRLHELPGWSVRRDGTVSHPQSPLRVVHIEVSSRSREVPRWDQPLLDCRTTGVADLCGTRIDGAIRFGFDICREPGLARHAELGPTVMGPGGADRPGECGQGHVVTWCRQSDEGGRFFRDITVYRIIDLGCAEADCRKAWLSLSEIRALLDRGGYFTNEARTLISLLMRYLVP
jgi:oxidase EvaA